MKNIKDAKTLEIVAEIVEENNEYAYTNLYVCHDGAKDEKFIRRINQIQELNNLSVGELFAEYIDEKL